MSDTRTLGCFLHLCFVRIFVVRDNDQCWPRPSCTHHPQGIGYFGKKPCTLNMHSPRFIEVFSAFRMSSRQGCGSKPRGCCRPSGCAYPKPKLYAKVGDVLEQLHMMYIAVYYALSHEHCSWGDSNRRGKCGRVDRFSLRPRSLISTRANSAFLRIWTQHHRDSTSVPGRPLLVVFCHHQRH